jgi:hypothetical protein
MGLATSRSASVKLGNKVGVIIEERRRSEAFIVNHSFLV